MGNPAYDARREAERAEATERVVSAVAAKEVWEAISDLMTGRAYFSVEPGNTGHIVRIMRDVNGPIASS